MACIFKNCLCIDGTERAVCCTLCDKFVHIICAKWSGRFADTLEDRSKGIYWYCPDCRKISSNLGLLLRQTRQAFNALAKDFDSVKSKFTACEHLLSSLDELNKPEKVNKRPNSALVLQLPVVEEIDLLTLSPIDKNPPLSVGTPSTIAAPIVPNEVASIKPVSKSASSSSESSSRELRPLAPKITSVQVGKRSEAPSTSKGVLHASKRVVSEGSSIKYGRTPLTVTSPPKTVFVSRLSVDTTEKNISDYISEGLPQPFTGHLVVKKFNFAYERHASSFKISLPSSVFDTVVNESFWPDGIIVHEFKLKKKPPRQVTLPSLPNNKKEKQPTTANNQPKN